MQSKAVPGITSDTAFLVFSVFTIVPFTAYAADSDQIGAGYRGTCGTVTIEDGANVVYTD